MERAEGVMTEGVMTATRAEATADGRHCMPSAVTADSGLGCDKEVNRIGADRVWACADQLVTSSSTVSRETSTYTRETHTE